MYQEVNFDGIVGPTHNYAGLAFGNRASMGNRASVSHPRAAALQGLGKMRAVANRGVRQAVLPPPHRPAVWALRRAGFTGDRTRVLETAFRDAPELFAACHSASGMWTANAVTTTPSLDAADGRLHVTPANLMTQFHRSLEAAETARFWRTLLPDPDRFVHHPPLPANLVFSDEGAANHTRLAPSHGRPGLHLFVHGRSGFEPLSWKSFPRRQTAEAAHAVARTHGLDQARTVHARQSPTAIEAGAFHNDVIATGNERLLLYHRDAFADGAEVVARLQEAYADLDADLPLLLREVAEFDLASAISSYFFNSQLLTLPDGSVLLLCPEECREDAAVARTVTTLVDDPGVPIGGVEFLNLRESMRNGGGPACLRNRVVMNAEEISAVAGRIFFDDALGDELEAWVRKWYRPELSLDELRDPALPEEVEGALNELSGILRLPSLYAFPRDPT